jgi:hypothetical protein
MFRISIFFDGGVDEAEELTERFADLMLEHTKYEPDDGDVRYFVTLGVLDEPEDGEELVGLMVEGAYRVLFGPRREDE